MLTQAQIKAKLVRAEREVAEAREALAAARREVQVLREVLEGDSKK